MTDQYFSRENQRHTVGGMTKEAVIAVVLMTAGCTTGPPTGDVDAREYRRADARIEAAENFDRLKRACAAIGGAVLLPRHSGGRVPPTIAELQKASCSTRPGTALSF